MRPELQSASMNSTAISRRGLILSTLACVSITTLKGCPYADAAGDTPAYVAAFKADQGYGVAVLAHDGTVLRQVPLSGRGHDIAVHGQSGRAVVFARRPGTFAVAFDLASEHEPFIFNAVEGRHFYGHGAFSRDGRLLYVSENAIAEGHGVIGVYETGAGYRKLGEMPSHGVGPHEIILLEDGQTLAVANGGIDTVPEAGRTMLNLDEMRPNLAFISSADGTLLARHELGADLNRLSIRHIAADNTGAVWFGGQWEGDAAATPELIGRASRDTALRLIEPAAALGGALKGYIGSVAASADGSIIAASAPKAGRILYLSAIDGSVTGESVLADGCGIAGEAQGRFAATSGLGNFRHELPGISASAGAVLPTPKLLDERTLAGIAFDNHLRKVV